MPSQLDELLHSQVDTTENMIIYIGDVKGKWEIFA